VSLQQGLSSNKGFPLRLISPSPDLTSDPENRLIVSPRTKSLSPEDLDIRSFPTDFLPGPSTFFFFIFFNERNFHFLWPWPPNTVSQVVRRDNKEVPVLHAPCRPVLETYSHMLFLRGADFE